MTFLRDGFKPSQGYSFVRKREYDAVVSAWVSAGGQSDDGS
jgi:hypothetical protein